MEIRLLGVLEVVDDSGEVVGVAGAKLRSLLAAMAIRPGQVVSADRLVEELWGDEHPASAGNSLQVLVSKLRRTLPPGVVATSSPGYVLGLPPESVDTYRFDALAVEGRKALVGGDFEAASTAFDAALALWRGPAMAEFAYEDFARATIARLEEERANVTEDRIEAKLGLGAGPELVAELEAAVSAEPLRERLRGQLMVALYRAGRQADALRQFQEARRVLGEELGLEPGPELRRLEAAILTHDPELSAAAPRTAAPKTSARDRTNLRAPPTATVGRDEEVASLSALMGTHRLVTVVGPGGVGKTRLALETGLGAQDGFAEGVWMVELGPLRNPDDVVPAVAGTLGIADVHAGAAGIGRVAEAIADRELLLIVDNCEHLIDESARVAEELLACCPRLRMLTTSREGLGLPGEVLWSAQPLPPDDAVRLFAARANEVAAAFDLTDEVRPAVLDICARLDGLPLAIELAAARVAAFPVAQIAARLDDRFRLLSRGSRTAASRQQTLRAVVSWSFDLLFDDERRLFNRMSVFVDGCDLESIEAVCADELIPADDIADLVARLVSKSLVVAHSGNAQARFTMLETLAEFSREQLAASGEVEGLKARHAAWYGALARHGRAALWGRNQKQWLRQATRELGNLGLAVDTAVEANDAQLALTIAGGMGGYWWIQGHPDLGLRWIDAALRCTGAVRPSTRGLTLMWAGFLGLLAGRRSNSTASIDEAIQCFDEAGDIGGVAFTEFLGMQVYAAAGLVERVPELAERARDHFWVLSEMDPIGEFCALLSGAVFAQMTGDNKAALRDMRTCASHPALTSPHARIFVLSSVADICEAQGHYAEASDAMEDARQESLELGMLGYDVPILARLSNLAMLTGDPDRAELLRGEAIKAARLAGFTSVLAVTYAGIATRQLRAGNLDASAAAAAPALMLYREADNSEGSALALVTLGWNAEQRSDAAAAADYFERAFVEARRAGEPRLVREAAEGLAAVALLHGDPTRAARLLGAASRLHDRPIAPMPDVATLTGVMFLSPAADPRWGEQVERAVRERIGPAAFAKAFKAGGPGQMAELGDLTLTSP